jgi:hypothetical protein
LHLARGPVAEGEGGQLAGFRALGEQMDDARNEDAGLAGTRTGQNQHRPDGGDGGGGLLGIEAGEQLARGLGETGAVDGLGGGGSGLGTGGGTALGERLHRRGECKKARRKIAYVARTRI